MEIIYLINHELNILKTIFNAIKPPLRPFRLILSVFKNKHILVCLTMPKKKRHSQALGTICMLANKIMFSFPLTILLMKESDHFFRYQWHSKKETISNISHGIGFLF